MKFPFSCNSVAAKHIAKAFCSCHDITAFVSCTNFYSDHFVFVWEQNHISITFELWWKNCWWDYLSVAMAFTVQDKLVLVFHEQTFELFQPSVPSNCWEMIENRNTYRKVSNIRRTLVVNKTVAQSDVVGASPVGAAPTAASFPI